MAALKRAQGKVAIITGATSGVGREVARELARRGWAIGLVARGLDALDATAREVRSLGGRALELSCDVANPGAIEEAAERAESTLGPIDVWINNAAVSIFAPVDSVTAEEYRRVTEVSYLGYVHGTQSALRRMRTRGRGTIIQVGSSLAYGSIPLHSAYCAAKHAVHGFTESLRVELLHEKSPIRLVHVVLPAVNTPQFDRLRSKMSRKHRPAPPIFEPQVAARAIVAMAMARNPRPELKVSFSSIKAVAGAKALPRHTSRVLARHAFDSLQEDAPDSLGRPDNLWRPVNGDPGARGRFGAVAHRRSPQLWASLHRGTLAVAAAGLISLIGWRKKPDRDGKGLRAA